MYNYQIEGTTVQADKFEILIDNEKGKEMIKMNSLEQIKMYFLFQLYLYCRFVNKKFSNILLSSDTS